MEESSFTALLNQIQKEMEVSRKRKAQYENGLVVDGDWGPQTRAALNRVEFPEWALGLPQPPATRPTAFKRYSEGGYTYDASGVTDISSLQEIDREMSRQIHDQEQREFEREREIQQSMAYGVAPGVHFGWWAYVFDGEHRWRWWRPTRGWAEDTGRFVLRNEVRYRQRRWANQHPEMRNAKDLWIVPPTDLESWVEAFKQAEGKQ